MLLVKLVRSFIAQLLAAVALVLPYRIRTMYVGGLSYLIHLPFVIFGRLARQLLRELNIVPGHSAPELPRVQCETHPAELSRDKGCVLFSGGTDSTCATALIARQFKELHLLTFSERATRHSPHPAGNVERLRRAYPATTFISLGLDVDHVVRFLSYESYLKTIWRHGWLVLATCAYSSLSWHIRAIQYCRENGITVVHDGLTRELMHFPGHMDVANQLFRELYQAYGITYLNPVREWPTPPDHQFIDQVIVNSHIGDYVLGDSRAGGAKTTGRYLFEAGVFPAVDIKGTRLDFQSQHDCYPFALYNFLAFWHYLSFAPYEVFCQRVAGLLQDKIAVARKSFLESSEAT